MSWRKLLDLIAPVQCQFCYEMGQYMCPECQGIFLESNHEEVTNSVLGKLTIGFIYNKGLEQMWKVGKHQGYYEVVTYLGGLLGQELTRRGLLAELLTQTFVPVPLAAAKQRERGFNQVELMLRGMHPKLKVQNLLIRTRDTQTQIGQNRWQRQENLAGAFAISPRFTNQLLPQSVVLVDDVYTTGTTLRECAQALRAAGVNSVSGLVFAKG